MYVTLQEFVHSRGLDIRVDREHGIIRGVKILGLESRNGRSYSPAALREAAPLYEGAKVNVNHPKGNPLAPRDYQDRIGFIRNVELRETDGLFGDFFYNPRHTLAEQLAWDAEHASENVGFSHNVQARVARQGDKTLVESITRVQSVDLVADPATTAGLFESTTDREEESPAIELSRLTIEQLRTERPDLVETLLAEQAEQLCTLRAECDRLTSAQAAQLKELAARRLLREFDLPEPESTDPWSQTVVSEAFFAEVLSAADERQMRRLIEDRARLAHDSRPLAARRVCNVKPQCRDQHTVAIREQVDDARSFATSIRQ